MKILVTGGAGFIGSRLVEEYIKAGHRVAVIDNFSNGNRQRVNPGAVLYEADINNFWEVEEIFAIEKPDVVNHHAGQISVNLSVANPIYDASTNILGAINLLEASVRYGVKKFIFASSGGAIYDDAHIPATEATPAKPKSPYGIAKLTVEKYMDYYRDIRGLSTVVLRYSNVYGSGQAAKSENAVIPIFIGQIKRGHRPTVFGDGHQTRDFIHVDDVVRANLAVTNREIAGTFNIASGQETSVNQLLQTLQQLTGTNLGPEYLPAKPGEQRRSCLDHSLATRLLGWQPTVALRQGLAGITEATFEISS